MGSKQWQSLQAKYPERCSGDIKLLSATEGVWRNPDDEISEIDKIEEKNSVVIWKNILKNSDLKLVAIL
jgi:hypothetical protein